MKFVWLTHIVTREQMLVNMDRVQYVAARSAGGSRVVFEAQETQFDLAVHETVEEIADIAKGEVE